MFYIHPVLLVFVLRRKLAQGEGKGWGAKRLTGALLLSRRVARHADKPWVVSGERAFSYGEIDERSSRMAQGFADAVSTIDLAEWEAWYADKAASNSSLSLNSRLSMTTVSIDAARARCKP